MQEINGDTGHIKNSQCYQNFIQQSIIGTIILTHLTMVDDSTFNGIKIVFYPSYSHSD